MRAVDGAVGDGARQTHVLPRIPARVGVRSSVTLPPPLPPSHWIWPALRMLRRIVLIALVVLLANYLLGLSMDMAETLPGTAASPMQGVVLMAALIVYALLIATPFVPGIEIGLALLFLRGASIAPAVYGATVLGLILAYLLGRFMKEDALSRLLSDLRLRRPAAFVHRITHLGTAAREAELEAMLPRWLSVPFLRYRYPTLALLLNLPGNVALGGGGGLMIVAGLSRLYHPVGTLLTIAIAVLPVPLMIWWFGTGMLTLLPTQ
ncbi:hypothetical protein [Hasllibacter sp. MH4015]|uniref:hypothetical protein n=1 Tax=Hasllibacter sp. MH4015 TaxID=2854029 RepID=UPI001CD5E530|nr:hypothetical protein [Hasllibacter sp. MH4015]